MSRLSITFELPSMAVQSAKSECDVHTILAQYRKTGVLPNRSDAYYADATAALGFADAYNLVLDAQAKFDALPAREREKYDNDVQRWMIASSMRSPEHPAADQPDTIAAGKAASAGESTVVAAKAATTHGPGTPPSEAGA